MPMCFKGHLPSSSSNRNFVFLISAMRAVRPDDLILLDSDVLLFCLTLRITLTAVCTACTGRKWISRETLFIFLSDTGSCVDRFESISQSHSPFL
jgi:hypothetical protein